MTSLSKSYAVTKELANETIRLWDRVAPREMFVELNQCSDSALETFEEWLVSRLKLIAVEKAHRMPF